MPKSEVIATEPDYKAELEAFKSSWGKIPKGLAPELTHFYATAPIRVREIAWFENPSLPETYEHAVLSLADFCEVKAEDELTAALQKKISCWKNCCLHDAC